MIVLDTSAVIELLKGTGNGKKIAEIVIRHKETAITAFTIFELLGNAREKEIPKLYAFFSSVVVLSFDAMASLESSKIKNRLKARGHKIGEIDIFIAGICSATNTVLITLDKDFERIEDIDAIILK